MSQRFQRFAALRLVKHSIDMSLTFIVVAILAIVLSFLAKISRFVGAPELVVHILTLLEYAILIVDSLVFLCCLTRGARTFLKETE